MASLPARTSCSSVDKWPFEKNDFSGLALLATSIKITCIVLYVFVMTMILLEMYATIIIINFYKIRERYHRIGTVGSI